MNWRRRSWVAVVFAVVVGIVIGSMSLGVRPGVAQTGATVTIALPADATTMDPQKNAVAFTDDVLVNVFEPLIRRDPSTRPIRPRRCSRGWRSRGGSTVPISGRSSCGRTSSFRTAKS